MRRSHKKKLILLLICLILVAAAAVWNISRILSEYRKGNEVYESMQGEDESEAEETEEVETFGVASTDPDQLSDDEIHRHGRKAMDSDNPNVRGWLTLPDTKIDYPVMQGEDNSYYLNHLPDGTQNANGALFMDALNEADLSDPNTVIYGHHMKNGSMFTGLTYYQEPGYYQAHPKMYLYTNAGDYEVQIFAAFTTQDDSDVYALAFGSEKDHQTWLDAVLEDNELKTDVKVTTADRILTMSTCTYSFEGARYVVLGKLVPM